MKGTRYLPSQPQRFILKRGRVYHSDIIADSLLSVVFPVFRSVHEVEEYVNMYEARGYTSSAAQSIPRVRLIMLIVRSNWHAASNIEPRMATHYT